MNMGLPLKVLALFFFFIFFAHSRQRLVGNDFGCSRKNQGELGTCHTFAFSCPIEHHEMMKSHGAKHFKLSMNWMFFVSMLDRLCVKPHDFSVHPVEGWFYESNFNRLKQMGYCEEETYLPYQPIVDPWLASSEKTKIGTSKLKDAKSSSEALWLSLNPSDESQNQIGFIMPHLEEVFKTQFGISSEDAKAVYCVPGNEKDSLEKIKDRVDPKFYQCAQKSLNKSSEFSKECRINEISLADDVNSRFDKFRENLSSGSHLLLSLKADSVWNGVGQGYHAVAATGFGAKPQWVEDHIQLHNSWDENSTRDSNTIKKEKLMAINRAHSFNCDSYKNEIEERYLPYDGTWKVELESLDTPTNKQMKRPQRRKHAPPIKGDPENTPEKWERLKLIKND